LCSNAVGLEIQLSQGRHCRVGSATQQLCRTPQSSQRSLPVVLERQVGHRLQQSSAANQQAGVQVTWF
jgi:hypothetical protein